jgi:hypothetical protein
VAGKTLATAIAATQSQYSGNIVWSIVDDDPTVADKPFPTTATPDFAVSTVYKAKVTLTAKDGFTFTGIKENSFTHTGADAVTNEADSGTVIITFKRTDDTYKQTVNVEFDGLPSNQDINLVTPEASLSWNDKNTLYARVVDGSGIFESSFAWYVDGEVLKDQNGNPATNASVSINARDYSLGSHTISVKVTIASGKPNAGQSYSKTARFTIVKDKE